MSQRKAEGTNVKDRGNQRFGVLTGQARFWKGSIEYRVEVKVNQNGQEYWLPGGQLEVLNEQGHPDADIKIPICDRKQPRLHQQTGVVLEFDFVSDTLS